MHTHTHTHTHTHIPILQTIDGTVSGSWEGIRVQSLATHSSSNFVYAADTHKRIRQYNFEDKSSATLLV